MADSAAKPVSAAAIRIGASLRGLDRSCFDDCSIAPAACLARGQVGVLAEIGIGGAISQAAGRRGLALLVGCKTAVAEPAAVVATLDAIWVIPGRRRRGAERA